MAAENRRRRKAMGELAAVMMASPIPKGSKLRHTVQALGSDLEDEDMTTGAAVMAGLVGKAIRGDVRAAELLLELEREQLGVTGDDGVRDDGLTTALMELAREMDRGQDADQ